MYIYIYKMHIYIHVYMYIYMYIACTLRENRCHTVIICTYDS